MQNKKREKFIFKLNEYFSQIIQLFHFEIKNALINISKNYKNQRKKVIIIISLSLIFLSFITIFIYSSYKSAFDFNHTQINYSKEAPKGGDNIGEEQIKTINNFLNFYDNTIDFTKPLLDNFVSKTSDVTTDQRIQFSDNTSILSPIKFYDLSFSISLSLIGILILAIGINYLLNPEDINYKGLFIKIISVLFFLFAGRILLSLSISLTNGLNEAIISTQGNNASLTDYMHQFIQSIRDGVPESSGFNPLFALKSTLLLGTNDIWGLLSSLPLIIPLFLILIMFLFISFQFIYRFFSLYFLSVLQPLSAIFLLNEKTKNINSNFWKNWLTLLIHQPFFILGFALIQAILLDMLKTGPNFSGLIIFLVSLTFLSTVGVFSARIFGDTWTAIGNLNGGKLWNGLIDGGIGFTFGKGINFKRGIVGGWRGSIGENIGDYKKHNLERLFQQRNPITLQDNLDISTKKNTNNFSKKDYSNGNHKVLLNPLGSEISKSMLKEGYSLEKTTDANGQNTGVIKYSGDFYSSSNGDGTSTLYISKSDALSDGQTTESLKKISVTDLPILDTSNRKEISEYNSKISRIRSKLISEGREIGDTHLKGTGTSSKDRVLRSLDIGREYNKIRNIKGIAVKRYGSKQGKGAKRQIQIHVYDDAIKEE